MVGDNDNAVGEDTADRWEWGDVWSTDAGERDGCAVRSWSWSE
jgi:hypothetical protein